MSSSQHSESHAKALAPLSRSPGARSRSPRYLGNAKSLD